VHEVAVRGDGFRGVEDERGLEHGEAEQDGAVVLVEQVDAPGDRREKCLLAGERAAAPV